MTTVLVRDYHRTGFVFPKDALPGTAQEAMAQSSLDWKVEREPIFLENGDKIQNNYAMRRTDNGDVFGIVGGRYTSLQNIEAFNFFDSLVKDGVASYEAAGASKHGSRVWIRAKLNDVVEVADKDKIGKYVVLTNTHDGTGSVHVFITPYRFVCSNALAGLIRSAKYDGEIYSIRHTHALHDRAKQAIKTLESVNETYKALAETWTKMAEFELPPEKIEDYFGTLFPDKEGKKSKNKGQEIRDDLKHYLTAGRGHELGLEKTLWGTYNAVTEYLSHNMSSRKGSTEEKHFDSLMFGDRAKKNEEAMKLALEMMAA